MSDIKKVRGYEYDAAGRVSYFRYSDGSYNAWDYTDNDTIMTYFSGKDKLYWWKLHFDSNGNKVCYETSNGVIIVYF